MIFDTLRITFPYLAVLATGLALLPRAGGQEVPRPSLARQQLKQQAPPDYNLKVGQVLLTADASVTAEYIDNVYLAPDHVEGDFTVKPEFGLSAAWQVTQLNVLRLRTSVSYTKYLDHPELDSQNINLAPDSALSFSVFVGDVRIEMHDQFALQNETAADGAPGGVARLPRFTNTVGISLLWDMNDLLWTVGYDHYNFVTLGSAVSTSGQSAGDLSRLDHSTDQISTSVSAQINSTTTLGLEAAAGYSQYPNEPTSDFTSFSVGPTLEVQLTTYSSFAINAGFKGYSFEAGPPVLAQLSDGSIGVVPGREAGLATGYYAKATVVHRLNQYYRDRFEVGHEDQADALSGRTESNYIRYSSSWIVNRSWTIGLSLSFEDVRASAANGGVGGQEENYQLWGGQLNTGYRLTEHVNLTIAYQLLQRDSDISTQSYTQNRVAVGLGYRF